MLEQMDRSDAKQSKQVRDLVNEGTQAYINQRRLVRDIQIPKTRNYHTESWANRF